MFIVVKYGQNESLICNPSCAVVNLLTSIKRRAGYGNTNLTIDLSDETGLIKELDGRKNESANSLLSGQATYVLLRKDPLPPTDHAPGSPKFTYTALLEHIEDLFPDFQLRLAEMDDSSLRPKKAGSKAPTPAGRLLVKPAKRGHHHRVAGARRK